MQYSNICYLSTFSFEFVQRKKVLWFIHQLTIYKIGSHSNIPSKECAALMPVIHNNLSLSVVKGYISPQCKSNEKWNKLLQKVCGFMNSSKVMLDKCSHYTQNHLLCILSPTEKEKRKKIRQLEFYDIHFDIERLRKAHIKLIKS